MYYLCSRVIPAPETFDAVQMPLKGLVAYTDYTNAFAIARTNGTFNDDRVIVKYMPYEDVQLYRDETACFELNSHHSSSVHFIYVCTYRYTPFIGQPEMYEIIFINPKHLRMAARNISFCKLIMKLFELIMKKL